MRLVSEKHVTTEGVPRIISYHEATPGNPKDYYVTKKPDAQIKNQQYLKSCDTRKRKADEKILSHEEIDILRDEVRHRMTCKKWGRYYINGFALLFAIETGVRAGELCALK